MKIHSAYLQNQIPEGPKAVRPEQTDKAGPLKQLSKQKPAEASDKTRTSADRLELSENSRRILSASEKEVFALLYQDALQGTDQTYDQAGRAQEQDQFAVGKKIDIKG